MVPEARLELAQHCCREIFLPATAFAATCINKLWGLDFLLTIFNVNLPDIKLRSQPSSLYTFMICYSHIKLGSGLPLFLPQSKQDFKVSPNLTGSTPRVSPRAHNLGLGSWSNYPGIKSPVSTNSTTRAQLPIIHQSE